MPRYFTLSEANEALRIIKPLMDEIQSIRKDILAKRPEVWPAIERSAGNGGNAALSKLVVEFERLDQRLHQLQKTGVSVKDINTGLLDFPAIREGHEVYLCWQHGEDQIAFWHEVDAGYAGRQSIEHF